MGRLLRSLDVVRGSLSVCSFDLDLLCVRHHTAEFKYETDIQTTWRCGLSAMNSHRTRFGERAKLSVKTTQSANRGHKGDSHHRNAELFALTQAQRRSTNRRWRLRHKEARNSQLQDPPRRPLWRRCETPNQWTIHQVSTVLPHVTSAWTWGWTRRWSLLGVWLPSWLETKRCDAENNQNKLTRKTTAATIIIMIIILSALLHLFVWSRVVCTGQWV